MDSHSWDKLTMHASHIENKDSNLTLNSFFEISKSAILLKKKSEKYRFILQPEKYRSVFTENIDQFCDYKNTNLYLRKIQISFETRKKFRSVSKENTDQFCI